MSVQQVLQFGIARNLVAGVGALGFAWLDDRIGSRTTMVVSLAGLAAAGCAIPLVRSQPAFWAFGPLFGVFVAPVQAAARRNEHRRRALSDRRRVVVDGPGSAATH